MASSSGNQWINSNINLSPEVVEDLKSYKVLPEKNIYIFFSFDLVGSTKFKTDEKDRWPSVIFRFYELINKELKNEISQIRVWKYLGDEVLLFASICDLDICTIPKMVFSVQSKVAKDIRELFDAKKLDVKSTIWIAGVQTLESKEFKPTDIPKTDEIYKNLKIKLNIGEFLSDDFIGPDMDTGFRVAKFAFHHKVVLSADFAYLLYKMSENKDDKINDNLRIVSYEILKGVWNEQYYPIVWYYSDWKTEPYGFFYADHKKNDIAERVWSKRIDPIEKLTQVYEELGKTAEINAFVEECSKKNFSKERDFLLHLETRK